MDGHIRGPAREKIVLGLASVEGRELMQRKKLDLGPWPFFLKATVLSSASIMMGSDKSLMLEEKLSSSSSPR